MIVTLAGHVDHGKSALVHALTGTKTDRLAEEKRRGLTLDQRVEQGRLARIGRAGQTRSNGNGGDGPLRL